MDSSVETPIGRGRFSSCFSCDREWVAALLQAVMREGLILLLTVVLSSFVAVAQTPTPQIVPGEERVAPIITGVQTVPVPSTAASFVLSEDPGKSTGHFSYYLFARAYERDQRLENLSPIDRVKTLFLTQSSLPLLQLWGGRLHLDGFTNRLHMQNVQIGPSAIGGLQNRCPPQRGYPGGPRSARFYGLSLSFHFGREAEIRRPTKAWRCFPRTVGAPR